MSEGRLPPDHAQRAEALDVTRSFIVQAPAGSGKTELLTQRYLHLLGTVKHASEIVAITFTRKAAAEMRARIAERLQAAQPGQAAWRARENQPQLLQEPETVRVVTFDTLFRSLTRACPLALGVSADALIDEAPRRRYERAAQAALADPDLADATRQLLQRLDGAYGSAMAMMATLLEKRDQWLPLSPIVTATEQDPAAAQRRLIVDEVERVLGEIRAALCAQVPQAQINAWLVLARFGQRNVKDGVNVGADWPQPRHHELAVWSALFQLVLTKEFTIRKRFDKGLGFPPGAVAEKAQVAHLAQSLTAFEAMLAAHARALAALPASNALDALAADGNALNALMRVLTHAAAYLSVDFSRTNTIDFIGIALAAQRGVLGESPPLEEPIARGIRHLLIDEFQDTSISQFTFLEGVVRAWQTMGEGGETLFCVGDPMQSIYRFRQAEVELFSRAQREGIGDHALAPITLSANFRSDAIVVDWVNAHLASAINSTNVLSPSRLTFAPGVAMHRDHPQAQVCLRAFEQHGAEGNFIVERVKDILLNTTDRIGVLVSTRRAGAPLVQALREAGVAFDARESERLADALWVRDLLAIAYALSDTEDVLSWLALLRAPWCGLTLSDLTVIAQAASETRDVWHTLMTSDRAGLSGDGAARVAAFVAQLSPCVRACGVRALADVVEAAWARFEARAINPASSRADFESVIETIRTYEVGGKILDRAAFESALNDVQRAAEGIVSARVQVLTIHKAKGLQFETVIVPGLAKRGAGDTPPLLRWARLSHGPVLVPRPNGKSDPAQAVYDWLAATEAAEQDAERARLLYVATTRAMRRLLLTATVKCDPDGTVQRPAHTLLAALPAHTQIELVRAPAATVGESVLPAQPPRFQRRAQPPLTPREIVTRQVSVPERDDSVARAARAFGVVAHAWLASQRNTGRWSQVAAKWAYDALAHEGVDAASRDGCSEALRQLVERVATCEQAAFIFDPTHRAWDELTLTGVALDGDGAQMRPDRVIQTSAGDWWIVDYKTASPRVEQTLEAFLADQASAYQSQLARYAHAVRQWQNIPTAQPVRTALYFPMLGVLKELP
jgi:ATP-dependent exoDNAse (exonuclease V) beta subunit